MMYKLVFKVLNVCTNEFEDWNEDNEPPPCRDKDCSTCPYNETMIIPNIDKED